MPAPSDGALLGALDLLRQRRQPYGELLAEIVAATLARFPPPAAHPLVEIGSGSGQLRQWLPAPLRERVLHTDPSEPALRALRERAPDAKARVASAEQLPFADASTGAVLGLCVFDAVADQARVVAELARVLCPGGRFIHFADMATLLEAPFAKLAASGLVPLPNVFGDPGDHPWPLDIILVKRDWLSGLVDVARRLGHPLPAAFSGFLAVFLAPPAPLAPLGPDPGSTAFDPPAATRVFQALAASAEWRGLLRSLLESAGRASFASGYPAVEPLPFHSGRYLESLLETGFRQSGAFRVEQSEIVTRARWRPRRDGSGPRYMSLCLGHQRIADAFPARLLAEPPPAPEPDPGGPEPALVEAGVFVFVAVRQVNGV